MRILLVLLLLPVVASALVPGELRLSLVPQSPEGAWLFFMEGGPPTDPLFQPPVWLYGFPEEAAELALSELAKAEAKLASPNRRPLPRSLNRTLMATDFPALQEEIDSLGGGPALLMLWEHPGGEELARLQRELPRCEISLYGEQLYPIPYLRGQGRFGYDSRIDLGGLVVLGSHLWQKPPAVPGRPWVMGLARFELEDAPPALLWRNRLGKYQRLAATPLIVDEEAGEKLIRLWQRLGEK
ncbi:hypothetical protein K8R78_01205 [bacterium]|nr:hypothetical protein [bacterium]